MPGSESYTFNIPLLHLPGRAGMDLDLTLYYNSHVWTATDAWPGARYVTFNVDRDFPGYGFRLGFGYLEAGDTFYVLTESDGTKRKLTYTSGTRYDSVDSSYITFDSSTNLLIYKDGTRVLYEPAPNLPICRVTQITDRNGNFISVSYVPDSDQKIATITDTLGRQVFFAYNTDGLLQSVAMAGKTYASFEWTQETFTYSWGTGLWRSNTPPSGTALKVLTKVTLLDGTAYRFVYNPDGPQQLRADWGIVRQIDLLSPSNALLKSVTYNYPPGTTPLTDLPTFTQQTIYDGVNNSTWTYGVAKTNGVVSSYVLTEPSGTRTTTYLNQSGLATLVQITDDTGHALRSTYYDWTSGSDPRVYAIRNVYEDTGQSAVMYYTYGSYGNIAKIDEYDVTGSLKRSKSITYAADATFTGACHILNLPTQVILKTGNAVTSRTDYAYSANPTTPTGTFPGYSSTGCGYSPTTITQYSNPAAATGPVARSRTYDKFGNLLSDSLDQLSWDYSPDYHAAYVTRILRGATLAQTYSYNFDSGTLASRTDENNQTTTFGYDSADRLNRVTYPNQVSILIDTSFSGNLRQVTRSTTANSLVQITDFDALGNAVHEEVRNGSTVVSKIDRAYSMGRLSSVTNPYTSGTPLVTSYDYDALGRVRTVTPPGNSGSYTYSYTGNTVTATDPAGKQRRSYGDGLGRLVQVDEPGWGDGTPARGSVTISGSVQSRKACYSDPDLGHWCETIYDAGTITVSVNGLTKIVQYEPGNSSASLASAIAAAFSGDPASPVYASVSSSTVNFTSKVNSYSANYALSASSSYDDANFFRPSFNVSTSGYQLTGGRAAAVEGNPSLDHPMVTTYTYDALDHVTKVSQAEMGMVNGQPAPAQDRTYVYDGLGNLTSETTPEGGATTYAYTDTGLLYTRSDSRGIISTYGYDALRRLTSITYSDGTPSVTYSYGTDGSQFENGKLISRS
ncbi:MAG: RHS repeat domain-containing protein, partial [Terriglobales bacterium]